MIKNLPEMKETWVRSLGWEDPLAKGMVTHSSSLAWIIAWTEEPGGLQSMGSKSQTRLSDKHSDKHTHTHTHTHTRKEGEAAILLLFVIRVVAR